MTNNTTSASELTREAIQNVLELCADSPMPNATTKRKWLIALCEHYLRTTDEAREEVVDAAIIQSLIESARCLGCAQSSSDGFAIEYWSDQVDRYSATLRRQRANEGKVGECVLLVEDGAALAIVEMVRRYEADNPPIAANERTTEGEGELATHVQAVIAGLKADPAWAWSYHCAVAMSIVDEGCEHSLANRGAARFMRMWAGVEPAHELPAPQPAPAVSEGWQPIETAPKNGTAILLLYKGHALEAAWKCVDSGDWETSQGPMYYWDSIFDCFDDGTEPTHWMPRIPLAASPEYKP